MGVGLLTLLVWAPSSTSTDSMEGIEVLARTPYATIGVAEAMASTTTLALVKKPSTGVPMAAETSLIMG